MKTKLSFSFVVMMFFSYFSAQQITVNPTMAEYWYWATGVTVVGENFTPNTTVNLVANDPNGAHWKTFSITADSDGKFTTKVNAQKNKSILGGYTVVATGTDNLTASANFNVTSNPWEIVTGTISANEIAFFDFYTGPGLTVTLSGLTPGGLIKINMQDPASNGLEYDPANSKYADENGQYTFVLNGTSPMGTSFSTTPMPQIPGVWGVSFLDFTAPSIDGMAPSGSVSFRLFDYNTSGYCTPSINYTSNAQPITNVEFSNINNPSSITSTVGYEDYTNLVADVVKGETYPIKIHGKAQWNFNANTYTVFIDWNHNNILDDAGEVYSVGYLFGDTTASQELLYNITIPEDALVGATRMRVLKVNSASSTVLFWPSGACGAYNYGQIEDYTVNVQGTMGVDDITKTDNISIYPNPVKDILHIVQKDSISKVEIYDLSGKLIQQSNTNSNAVEVNVQTLVKGVYLLKVISNNGKTQTTKLVKN